VVRAIVQAGFRPLLIVQGDSESATTSGMVVRRRCDGRAEIRWAGLRDVGSWRRRRSLLAAYTGVLRAAGLGVQCVEDDNEPYLICHAAAREHAPPVSDVTSHHGHRPGGAARSA
jgi:hypothetical protein